jgi:hypothetical protein
MTHLLVKARKLVCEKYFEKESTLLLEYNRTALMSSAEPKKS